MGSSGRVRWVQLWLMATLTFFSQINPSDAAPLKVLSAPNLLRIGTEEKIFVEVQDYSGENDLTVTIFVKNHPTKTRTLASTTVTLTKTNNFQAFGRITIPAGEFSEDPKAKQYVNLQADIADTTLEKVVLVSFQSGYIFIQTDKPIYTPSSTVRYRIFPMTPGLETVERQGQSQGYTSVTIDVMTPDGIIVESTIVSAISPKPGTYQLPDIVSFGQWKIVAKFHGNKQESFTAEFEVKEYVLPSFEVKISPPPESPFFYIDSKELNFTIKATYMFGKEVDGTAYVVFGLLQGDTKKSFPSSLQRVPIQQGTGRVTLKKEHITNTFPNINEQEGKSIYVAVSVLTESESEMVEAELRGIKIVKSPYTILFKKTPKYFKPGMTFDVMVEVLNPDNSPAKDVPVMVQPGGHVGNTAANGMTRLTVNTVEGTRDLTIIAKTNHSKIASHRQASASMRVYPYGSTSNSFLHMSVDRVEVEIKTDIKINFNIRSLEIQQNDLTYLILSRGQLIRYGRYKLNRQNQIALMVTITKDMLPSFRIVAYYHTGTTHDVVSDSLWIDVKDTCMGKLELQIVKPVATYEPHKSIKLKITGDPKATVGLVAVDKSVFVMNNKNRLTQKKIWDTVEQYDTGCTAGGGKNNMYVFHDAGLLFETNNGGTPYRTDLNCPGPSRRKRASTIMEVKTNLVMNYESLQKECCLDGMKDTPVSYTCERRSEYIVDGLVCKEAFLHCCNEIQKHREEMREELLLLARNDDDDGYTDRNDIYTRSKFPESWLWYDISLSACPGDNNCEFTSFEKLEPLPDTITTWQLTAISQSRTNGICVASPVEVVVFKPFFIDLRLPYSAVLGEQLEIRAILHNYGNDPITVRVEHKEDTRVCSAAHKKGWSRQEVQVGAETTRSVPIIIIPMKHGDLPIEVKASVKHSQLSDGIRKNLRVVPPGVLIKSIKRIILDPARKGVDGKQLEIINSEISLKDLAPETPRETFLTLTGIEQMSSLLDNAISGESMGTLITEPKGCGEQNAAAMTLPVIAATYLDKTSKWETVGFDKRNKAIEHIKKGYKNELTYRKEDGSFAIMSYSKSTTWLTAYVAKLFAMGYNYVSMDRNVICGAIKFLILKTQLPDGMFMEIGNIYDKNMIGDVGGVDSDVSMTAFCLIAMQESKTICTDTVTSLPSSINKAVAYLERRLPRITNPYAVAMTSYALANEKKLNKAILFQFAASDRTHWPVRKGHIYTLEATAYALLALVKAQAFEEANPVVRWLSQQQKVGGGYGSTQATIMVYQAVAEYCANVKEPPYDLNVDISIQGRQQIDKQNFNRENHYSTRTSKFEGINKDVKLTATGTGEVMFNKLQQQVRRNLEPDDDVVQLVAFMMVSMYYALPSKQESDCEMFDLTVNLLEEKNEETERIYKLKIEVLYKNKERSASMSILDIGLPTGYTFNKHDLDAMSTGRDRIIQKYESDMVLSEKGSLIIYLETISNTRQEEVSFRIHQKLPVGALQPAAVSVYEYYNKKQCVKFYRPERLGGELLRLCRNNECVCAEENCSKQRKEGIRNEDRTEKACESTATSKIDFVYKVAVESFHGNFSTDTYMMRVLEVYKEGNTDKGSKKKQRTFIGYQHCREALGLSPEKTYLIMGSSSDIYVDGTSYQYVLGENTWVEYWPNTKECQNDTYRLTCLGMEELIEQIRIFGCEMK